MLSQTLGIGSQGLPCWHWLSRTCIVPDHAAPAKRSFPPSSTGCCVHVSKALNSKSRTCAALGRPWRSAVSTSSSSGASNEGWNKRIEDVSSHGGAHGPHAGQGGDQQAAAPPPIQDANGEPIVPWGAAKIFQVMALWLLAYVIIGQVALPIALTVLGIDRDAMSIRGHALLHLSLDMSQLGVTLLILWQTLKSYKPRMLGFFPIRWRGWWPLAVLLGCAVFPAVDFVAHQSISWLPVEADGWGGQMEASLSMGDWITNAAYFSVVSICAPIWEEAIFRGFLLTSMTRYMPTYVCVCVCVLLFAMCHFRHQTFLPLLMLGSVFSAIFIKTRNLLPPIVLHSLWNVYVMLSLIRGNGVY
ncbi:CAAX protease self-immunity-domain-containing protein [Dunaliella salina]|uniref:CAAX protease self-immunity-domain-containing protein n=1 Tax=Dunaliella salina TaxID=3046 RepID=A0ABQ7G0R6_DUNSA|nr:CAAX protease self-immunity-domain-containing protein [Dunaliella salina]|eukprot:KAF5828196.1 CAAX protease self-immunity-domain-containing protein [Dunaliella salina]